MPGMVHDVSATGSTYFVEPLSAVNANNALRELELKEKKEIERILAELSAEAAGYAENVGTGSCQRHADALAQAGVGARDHSVFTVQRKEIHNIIHCVFLL